MPQGGICVHTTVLAEAGRHPLTSGSRIGRGRVCIVAVPLVQGELMWCWWVVRSSQPVSSVARSKSVKLALSLAVFGSQLQQPELEGSAVGCHRLNLAQVLFRSLNF